MGPTHGPGFFQQYTDAIRKFDIYDSGTAISINHHAPIIDSVNLHRRDYNVVHQILPDGSEGITAFSGVFQHGINLPFLNCVNVDSNTYAVNNAFSQYYNHYHCAVVPIYAENKNEMHTLFFGGIAQYYDSLGILVQDNNVPFVKTIARVTRDGSGLMSEYKLPIEMPAYLGASSEFIPVESNTRVANGVLKQDSLLADTTLLGYIYGGISSNDPNIFFINTGTQSVATSQIFKVYYIKNSTQGIHDLNEQSIGSLKMMVYPNPNDGNFIIQYNLVKNTDVKIKLVDMNGRVVEEKTIHNQKVGEHIFEKEIDELIFGGIYFLTIETSYESATQKLILTP
ncbi:MAG: T9SS type A sorting domain-containing protein [Bacteroidetes bacterium]|nr:T9SS type A sorting domain-containing protein [Bacteroidota bacterium]